MIKITELKPRAKIKGDAGLYPVWGINWLNQEVSVHRSCGDEWINFEKIQDVMLPSGVNDINGQPIFQGDISIFGKGKIFYEVIFDDGAFFYKALNGSPMICRVCRRNVERRNETVIGDIHHNPELRGGPVRRG